MHASALLTIAEMYRADAAAADAGVPGLQLMEAAGGAIAREIRRRWRPRPTLVLCGPGNNGGDGFVVARLLQERGWPVRLALFGAAGDLKGDAAVNAGRWQGPVRPLDPVLLDARHPDGGRFAADPLIVDALFGAGLTRPVEGIPAEVIAATAGRTVVAVDVPSGVQGDTGAVLGSAPEAALTVTFFRGKPGHRLYPGRGRCGEVVIVDIGIPDAVLAEIAPTCATNDPEVWGDRFPRPEPDDHKYNRGHAVVVGGAMTGAGRLAALAARRAGAGLVTVLAPADLHAVYAADSPGTIVRAAASPASFPDMLADQRHNTILIGPGAGVAGTTRAATLAAVESGRACVIDADALTAFQADPQMLFEKLDARSVVTPHDGEFARVFKGLPGDLNRLTRAREAAAIAGAVVLLKGPDTVIAHPDGRAVINTNAPAELATAGAGDVLAGIVLGLIAQGMPTFEAAAAAVWLHGRAATLLGPGLIAEDLVDVLPAALAGRRGLPADTTLARTGADRSGGAGGSRWN